MQSLENNYLSYLKADEGVTTVLLFSTVDGLQVSMFFKYISLCSKILFYIFRIE